LHFDHVGWNTFGAEDGQPIPFFPNATVVLTLDEWTYLLEEMKRRDAEPPFFTRCVAPIERTGRLHLVDVPHAVCEDVSILAAPGHTPGHAIVRVDSCGKRATIIGDASHHAAQVAEPEWSPLWDSDRHLAIRTRRSIFSELADDPSHLIVAGHWGYPGVGLLKSASGGLRYVAV
jgi:glyoxylase-like metal-dependent hydrolase (beta-lactamase superfamily II)